MKKSVEQLISFSLRAVTLVFAIAAFFTGNEAVTNVAYTLGVIISIMMSFSTVLAIYLTADLKSPSATKIFGKERNFMSGLKDAMGIVTWLFFIAIGWQLLGGYLLVVTAFLLATLHFGREKYKALQPSAQ